MEGPTPVAGGVAAAASASMGGATAAGALT